MAVLAYVSKMPKFTHSGCILALFLLVAGCSFNPHDNAQTRAGITDVQIKFCSIGPVEAPTAYAPCLISYMDGKERTDVKLSADLGKGLIEYKAGGSLAFDGQALRAAVEKAMLDAQVKVTGEVVDAITAAVIKSIKPL
jgi:hypothetical protein